MVSSVVQVVGHKVIDQRVRESIKLLELILMTDWFFINETHSDWTGEGRSFQTRAMSWGVQMEAEVVRRYQVQVPAH